MVSPPFQRALTLTGGNGSLWQLMAREIQRSRSLICTRLQLDENNGFRVIENISIFNFKLSDGEMRQLDAIDTRIRLFLFDL